MRHLYHSKFELDKVEVPTSAEQAQDNLSRLAATSRRTFLGGGLAAAAGVAGMASTAQAQRAGGGPLPSLYPGSTRKYFQELQFDEASHVNINRAAVISLGGTPRPAPTFQGITNLTATQLLQLGTTIANTGVGALSGASFAISNPAVYAVGASILFVEAYHAGFLNSQSNIPLVPNSLTYDVPLTQAQVVQTVSPYIASFNDPNNQFPASFSTTEKSTANDIAILNFAVILDYLEAQLYFNNVPRLFG
jgi:hypothetical protein